jgi:hypothetical protein
MYQFLRTILYFYHYLAATVLIAASFGISLRLGSKVSCTNSYIQFCIFITISLLVRVDIGSLFVEPKKY